VLQISIDRLIVEGIAPSHQRLFVEKLRHQLTEFAQSYPTGGAGARSRRQRIGALDAGVLRPGASVGEAARQVVAGLGGAIKSPRDDGHV
jgi:hypothetical protein